MSKPARSARAAGRRPASHAHCASAATVRPLRRILIANRGEIAVRIVRACRELGIGSVAVASEADRIALHAQLADSVVEIGPPPPRESYLCIDRILDAARATGCDAIHPGYGFLAENATFARAVRDAGLIFIGPPAEVIEAMGSKIAARERMRQAGVPVVPGGLLPDGDDEAAWRHAARAVGYPLLVKAAAGGGGKGMRRVDDEAQLPAAIGAARREAASAFGDPTVYLERLLHNPRHIEVQVFGDLHGNVAHLGERECSIQRRHQKIIEESPAAGLAPALSASIRDTAVRAAAAVGYVNAGTVELLLDASGEFYFLEMNTRLQVEHPVTEWVTGVDMVAEQIRIAQGEPLSWVLTPPAGAEAPERARSGVQRPAGAAPAARGHAIEARLYAEDPAAGFLPQTGRVLLFEPPVGPGVRVDTGIVSGAEVTLHYDPLIAKVSAWAHDRDAARRRLVAALRETVLLGPRSNLQYLIAILEHPAFAGGRTHTGFLDEHLPGGRAGDAPATASLGEPLPAVALLATAAVLLRSTFAPGGGAGGSAGSGHAAADAGHRAGIAWSSLGPLRLGEGETH